MDSSLISTGLIHDRITSIRAAFKQQMTDEKVNSSLSQMNKEAVTLARRGDHVGAVAHLTVLLDSTRERNVVHRDLFVCLGNRAASYLALGMYDEALKDALQSISLIQAAFPGCVDGVQDSADRLGLLVR